MDTCQENPFLFDVRRDQGGTVVVLHGELDMASAPTLVQCFQQLRTNRDSYVVVDLSDLEFCDSSGLSAFVHARQDADRHGARLIFTSPQATVRRLLELTRTDALLLANAPVSH